jgi:hypothetical protein
MGTYNPNNIKVGPGTLYAAPLGTAEPVSVTGAWPAGWTALGYTDAGSEFDFGPTTSPISVEEELWEIRQAITGYTGTMTFVLAEVTRQNLALVLNAGIGASTIASSQGTNGDGSLWQETPSAGSEVRVMLGWDSIPLAATTAADPNSRLIVRQTLQTGTVKRTAKKGANKSMYAASFKLEKPYGAQPFRFILEPNLAA